MVRLEVMPGGIQVFVVAEQADDQQHHGTTPGPAAGGRRPARLPRPRCRVPRQVPTSRSAEGFDVRDGKFQSGRGVLMRGVAPADVESKLRDFSHRRGRRRRETFALSERVGEWVLLGVPDGLYRHYVYFIAYWGFGTQDDQSPWQPIFPSAEVIVARYEAFDPDKSYYVLVSDHKSGPGSILRGRRDDGKGVVVNLEEESAKLDKDTRGFDLPTLDYLAARGVPEELRPGVRSFEFVPEARIDLLLPAD